MNLTLVLLGGSSCTRTAFRVAGAQTGVCHFPMYPFLLSGLSRPEYLGVVSCVKFEKYRIPGLQCFVLNPSSSPLALMNLLPCILPTDTARKPRGKWALFHLLVLVSGCFFAQGKIESNQIALLKLNALFKAWSGRWKSNSSHFIWESVRECLALYEPISNAALLLLGLYCVILGKSQVQICLYLSSKAPEQACLLAVCAVFYQIL